MAYVIFDLDGTVIDSSHRQNTKPDGSLDLDHWMEHNHYDMIMRDSLLPLADSMRKIKAAGHTVIVCTARAYQSADCEFLQKHGLNYDVYLSRGANKRLTCGKIQVMDNRPDAQLKVELLTEYFQQQGFSDIASAKAIMFDDNMKVLDTLTKHGIRCYNAVEANKRLVA